MDIVLITDGKRPDLLDQTLKTMVGHVTGRESHRLVVVVDGGPDVPFNAEKNLGDLHLHAIVRTSGPQGVGGAKNLGAQWFLGHQQPDPDGLLMFSDDDMYYLWGWDHKLDRWMIPTRSRPEPIATQLGGWRHPFHAQGERIAPPCKGSYPDNGIFAVDAVTGNCFVMRWKDWLKYGPFHSNALGPGQSEDYALSRKIVAGGGIIATLDPPVAIHCGLMNSAGEPATGWKEMWDMAREQIRAMPKGLPDVGFALPDELLQQINERRSMVDALDSALAKTGLSRERVVIERLEESLPLPRYPFPRYPSQVLTRKPACNPVTVAERVMLNVGSGQRRFNTEHGWVNVDVVSRPPDQIPDIILDARHLATIFKPGTVDMVVLHHVIEHFGCGEADEILRQCWKVLKRGGSLLIFVPDMEKLAGRWLGGEITNFTFMVNAYGAYQGEEGDRHRWGYSRSSLMQQLRSSIGLIDCQCLGERTHDDDGYCPEGDKIMPFNWREIPGADIAKDWWILGVEVVKP